MDRIYHSDITNGAELARPNSSSTGYYECDTCKKGYSDPNDLIHHYGSGSHPITTVYYRCPRYNEGCTKVFVTMDGLLSHARDRQTLGNCVA